MGTLSVLILILFGFKVSDAKIFQIAEKTDDFPVCENMMSTNANTKVECGLRCLKFEQISIFTGKGVCYCSQKPCKHEQGSVLLIEKKISQVPPKKKKVMTAFKSCEEIKTNHPTWKSDSYWINLPNPTLAYCDQDTDGGGWLRIGRLKTTSNADVSKYDINNVLSSNILDLNQAASQNFLLAGARFPTLKKYLKFHEFRVYCTKPYHGRINHASFGDQSTSKSKDFFNYLLGKSMSRSRMNTCQALKYMLDDNSVTQASDCSTNESSISSNVDIRFYNVLWFINGKTHISIASKYRLECDDYSTQSGYNNYGTWLFYVR